MYRYLNTTCYYVSHGPSQPLLHNSTLYWPNTSRRPNDCSTAPYYAFTLSLGNATEQPNYTLEVAENTLAVPVPSDEDFWYLHVDGASNYKGSGVYVVLVTSDGSIPEQAITLGFKASNNKAELLEAFQTYTLTQVLWADDTHTDALAGLGSALDHQLKHSTPMEYLDKPSIEVELAAKVSQVNTTPNWQDSIIDYLVNGTLLMERLESRKL
ncbi:hypothetical protein ACFX1T_012922 [Malus domestica]